MKAKVRAEMVLGRDLQPGDLFSTGSPEYWDIAMDGGGLGERVYIRTNSPCPVSQEGVPIYRLTVSGKEDQGQPKLFVWEDVPIPHTVGIMFALAYDAGEARQLIHRSYGHIFSERTLGECLGGEPKIITEPAGFSSLGGG